MMIKRIFFGLLYLMIFGHYCSAVSMSYQGAVLNSSGNVLTATPNSAFFSIYESSSGGTSGWSGVPTLTWLSPSRYSAELIGAESYFRTGTSRWLGIKLGANQEASPRIELLPVPYSFRSTLARSLNPAPSGLYSLETVPAVRVLVNTSGNVGIGTSSPVAKLDVAGNIRCGPIDRAITQISLSSGQNTLALDWANTAMYQINFDSSFANGVLISFTNPPVAASELTIVFHNTSATLGGGATVMWPASFKWTDSNLTLPTNFGYTMVRMFYIDGVYVAQHVSNCVPLQ